MHVEENIIPYNLKIELGMFEKGESFRKYARRFVERMRVLSTPEDKWFIYLESSLPTEMRNAVWAARNQGLSFPAVVELLEVETMEYTDSDVLQRWVSLKQKNSETAAAFYYRYKEMIEELRDFGMTISDKLKVLHFVEKLRDAEEISKM
jgi:hypothetical protein